MIPNALCLKFPTQLHGMCYPNRGKHGISSFKSASHPTSCSSDSQCVSAVSGKGWRLGVLASQSPEGRARRTYSPVASVERLVLSLSSFYFYLALF